MRWWLLVSSLVGCTRLPPEAQAPYAPTTLPQPTGPTVPGSTGPGPTAQALRLVTWNLEALGSPDSAQFEAVEAVLARLDADIVGLNELEDGEAVALGTLAERLGYPHVVIGHGGFGWIYNAVLSRLPPATSHVWASTDLCDDPSANDLTRLPVSVEVELPDGSVLAVVQQHYKSGYDDSDDFRRTVDAIRTAQVAAAAATDQVVVMGDINAELLEGTGWPSSFRALPTIDMPSSYWLGNDLWTELTDEGLINNAFLPLQALGIEPLDAQQPDGRWGTRDASGRRIDYVFASEPLRAHTIETVVYDARDDAGVTLPLAGSPPPPQATLDGSDHFPVVAEIRW